MISDQLAEMSVGQWVQPSDFVIATCMYVHTCISTSKFHSAWKKVSLWAHCVFLEVNEQEFGFFIKWQGPKGDGLQTCPCSSFWL